MASTENEQNQPPSADTAHRTGPIQKGEESSAPTIVEPELDDPEVTKTGFFAKVLNKLKPRKKEADVDEAPDLDSLPC